VVSAVYTPLGIGQLALGLKDVTFETGVLHLSPE
jgi:hypothetical protein